MPSDLPRPSDTVIRDSNAGRSDSVAPPGAVENMALAPRSTFHEEEGEGGRSEWWSLAKAVLIGVVVVMAIGWLLTR
ncbi:preprotein translocase subunit SecE [Muricoccus radiodurans]|uniref:preprotein translocase subunit SecE n=1 Tax=Muricoccus radiodurans TaxID=2231721 RepID=UPI003CF0D871